jgi:hypothetical protein
MSVVSIRAALETALNTMSPPLSTAWENVSFTPTAGTAYQAVHVLFASPDNREYGSRHQEVGYMQVSLRYPLQVGTATIAARAELIRTKFKRGSTFASGGYTVLVERTPEVGSGYAEGDRYVINVKIQFRAQVS